MVLIIFVPKAYKNKVGGRSHPMFRRGGTYSHEIIRKVLRLTLNMHINHLNMINDKQNKISLWMKVNLGDHKAD
jgi:hypothetical protein